MSRRKDKPVLQSVPVRAITARFTPAALLLVALSLMVFHRLDALPVERMRAAAADVMAPALAAVSAPFVSMAESIDGVATMRDLRAENIRLAEENAKLRQWYESALTLQAENKSLRELLNVKADPALVFVTARIIADPGGSFVKSVLLPVGRQDNVGKGNAVMLGKGLIGRVTEVGRHSSRVLLVTDLNSRIPVRVQNTRTRAILAGRNDSMLSLERLPPDSGLEVGQRIVTSGDGGQLPPDVPVGVIAEISAEGVFVAPLTDIDKATHVQVINTGMTPDIDGPGLFTAE